MGRRITGEGYERWLVYPFVAIALYYYRLSVLLSLYVILSNNDNTDLHIQNQNRRMRKTIVSVGVLSKKL